MEVSDVRRRLRAVIEQARRQAALRREQIDRAAREYDEFLAARAVPIVRTLAEALAAEGHRFQVSTPAGSVRLSSERSQEDYVELALDPSGDTPTLLVRSSRGRGRRRVTSERAVRDATTLATVTDEDILDFFLGELEPFVAR